MAAAQDTPGTPGHEDPGRGLGNDESFAGALATGTDAPEDPWARVVEQLAWEERRGASLAANLSAPGSTAPSATAPRPAALPHPAAAAPAADLPTKPALPETPAQYGQWRAQGLARGLRSAFITAADDFTSAPAPSPGPWLLAAPSPPALSAGTSGASRPDAAPAPPAMTPGLQSLPPVRHPGGLLGAVQHAGVLPSLTSPTTAFPMVATRDIGEVAAQALKSPPAETQIIELAGPQDYSFTDAAAAFAQALGKPVSAVPVPPEGIVPALTQAGVGEEMAGLMREMAVGMDAGRVAFAGGAVRAVRGKVPLAAVVGQLLGQKA